MAQDFTLYYFPSSYYSLKAYLTLQEKGVSFTERIVNIMTQEQQEDWYLKLNPKGEVPVLQHGSKFTPDSEAIIDYLDQHCPEGPRLAPDESTPIGQDVRELRQLLHRVPIDHISYGILANRQFCTNELRLPKVVSKMMNKAGAVKRLQGMIDGMKAAQKKLPKESQSEMTAKIKTSEERLSVVVNEEAMSKVLDDLEKVFDTIENRLEQSIKDISGSGDDAVWLMGKTFTAVDITAAVLIYRLYVLGIDERYFSSTKRTLVKEYYNRLLARPSMKKAIETSDSTSTYVAKIAALKVAKVGLLIGVAVLGVLAAREMYKGKTGPGNI